MFSKYVLCLLYNFNLWGFCTEFPELRTSQKWTRTILGVQLICSCFLCGFVWLFLHQLFYIDFDLITIVNDVLKFSLATFSYLCIIGESYYNRSKQQNFWIIYRRIRNDFNRSDCDPSFRNYFIKLLQFFITVTVVEIKHFTKRFSLIFFSTSYFGLMTMQEMRIFYYLFSVQLLDYQLNEIGTEVKLLADASENGRIPRGRLRWIRVYYDLVYDLSNYLNEVIGWSNVVNIMYLFLRLVFDLTWIYWQIQHKDGVAVFSMVWLFQVILPLIYLFNATSRCVIKYQNIVYHFNRIEIDPDDDELSVQIESTSLQLMRQPIVLHAKGFFVINYSTLLKLLGGITTYMVFYVQFSPKIDI